MQTISCALALLSGVIGAGFASGREIARFFSGRGAAASVILAALSLMFFFLRLCAKMEAFQAKTVPALCAMRFGRRLGAICGGLFFLLCAITAGAMLAACAELTALTLPLRHAYGAGMSVSLLLGLFFSIKEVRGLALSGAVLCAILPALLLRLFQLDAGEACFYPAMSPDLPVRAAADGISYAALNAALLLGMLPLLLRLNKPERRRAVALFALLFFALLSLGSAVCSRHMSLTLSHPMPFLALSRSLESGYLVFALCMYAAALSTLAAMLSSMSGMLPFSGFPAAICLAAVSLLFARAGFFSLVQSAYPVLGAVCAGLFLLLCA